MLASAIDENRDNRDMASLLIFNKYVLLFVVSNMPTYENRELLSFLSTGRIVRISFDDSGRIF